MRTPSRSLLSLLLVAVFVVPFVLVPPGAAAPEKPAAAERSAAPGTSAARTTSGEIQAAKLVNINTATVEDLMSLAGIGRKAAEKIVEYRTTHGAFRNPEEIRRVQGVGAGLWERNRERIVVK
jgi:competence protein ComEA